MTKPRLYIAAPLFSVAERRFNEDLAGKLALWFDVFLPQEDGVLMCDMILEGHEPRYCAGVVFRTDLEALEASDAIVIVLDGRSVDEGAAFELGVAYAWKKECVGLQTDVRRLLPYGNNPMIEGAVKQVFINTDDLIGWASEFSATHLMKLR